MLILWCLILRGISIEVGGHIQDNLWQQLWDAVFIVSNVLLAILFGAAAGNVGRGVPLDAEGDFSMAFFTNFRVHGNVGLLDWYTVSVATFAMVLLAAHGATYLVLKTEGPVHDRSRTAMKYLWPSAVVAFLAISFESWLIRPDVPHHAVANPFCWLGMLLIAASTVALISGAVTHREARAFVGSSGLIAGLLVTGAGAIFPVMLFSTTAPANSLTAYDVAADHRSLFLASCWWPISFALATMYFVFISRRYAGKVSIQRDNQGFY